MWTFSLVEGLGQGKPLVGLPMIVDQGLNCSSMVEWGFGVKVALDEISYKTQDLSEGFVLVNLLI